MKNQRSKTMEEIKLTKEMEEELSNQKGEEPKEEGEK